MMKRKNKFLSLIVCLSLVFFLFVGFGACKDKDEEDDEKNSDKLISTQEQTLEFSIAEKELFIYSSYQLHVNQTDGVTFASSDDSVCVVDEKGLVYANGFGEAVITAKLGDLQATCSIIVVGHDILPSIQVAQEDIKLVWSNKNQTGSTFFIQPQILFNGDTFTDGEFTFSSSDTNVVAVDEKGEISAKAIGTATVSVQGVWRDNFDASILNKNISVVVMPNANIELIPQRWQLDTINKTIGDVTYSNRTTFTATVLVDDEVCDVPLTYVINDETETTTDVKVEDEDNVVFWAENGMVTVSGNRITAYKAGQASIVAECVIEGIEICSVPLVIEVVAPTILVNDEPIIHNVKDNPVYAFDDMLGEFVSLSINGIDYTDYVDVQALSLDISDVYESVLGDNEIVLTTTKCKYAYQIKFVTNIISNAQEFEDCITNKSSKIYAVMVNDITFSVGDFTASSTAFDGVFDGQGHVIDLMGTKLVSVYGLFGRVKGELRDFALINATVYGKECTVLAERTYEGGAIRNVYVQAKYEENTKKDYSALDAKNTQYYCGLFYRGFVFENVIAHIEYPETVTEGYALCAYDNVILANNVYAVGNALQLAKTDPSVCYPNFTAMLSANLGSLTDKNGFSSSWYFSDQLIRFGTVYAGDATVLATITKSQSITLRLSDLTSEEIVQIRIDGKVVEMPAGNDLVLELTKFSANVQHVVEIYTSSCIIKQPFIFNINEEVKTTVLYAKESLQLHCSEYGNATIASVNGNAFEATSGVIVVDLTSLTIGESYDVYLYHNDGVIKQPIVRVTHIISTLDELKAYLPTDETRATATEGTYAVLTADIDFNGEIYSAGTGNGAGYKGHFNGLGHTISNVLLKHAGGFFGVLYKGSVIENTCFVNFVQEGTDVGCSLFGATVGRMGDGDATRMENLYIQGVVKTANARHGLFNVRTNDKNAVVMKNCIIDVAFTQPDTVSYAFGASQGALTTTLTNVLVRSNATQYAGGDTTLPYATTADLLAVAVEDVATWGGYWSVDNGEVYFNGSKVIAK